MWAWSLSRLYDFFTQDVARHNAATAAGRLIGHRQQVAEVEWYLRQRQQRPTLFDVD
jgi:hypothetical protein